MTIEEMLLEMRERCDQGDYPATRINMTKVIAALERAIHTLRAECLNKTVVDIGIILEGKKAF
jgi:hypothetical protein